MSSRLAPAFGTDGRVALADYEERTVTGFVDLAGAWREVATTGSHNDQPKLSTEDTAIDLKVASSSGTDTAAGTGARKVRVVRLNASMEEQVSDVTLTGTTEVSVTAAADVVGLVGAWVVETGSDRKQAGTISLGTGVWAAGAPANYHGKIPLALHASTPSNAPTGRTHSCVVPIPAGKLGAVLELQVVCEEEALLSLDLWPKSSTSAPRTPPRNLWSGQVQAGVNPPIRFRSPFDLSGTPGQSPPDLPAIPAESWIALSGIQDSAAGSCSVVMTYALLTEIS